MIKNLKENIFFGFTLSIDEFKIKYRSTFLGNSWVVLINLIFVVIVSFFWSIIFNVKFSLLFPKISLSLITWMFVASILAESTAIYRNNHNLILNTSKDLLAYYSIGFFKNLFIFLMNCGTILIISFFFVVIAPIKIFFPLIIFITCVHLFLLGFFLSMLALRFSDFGVLITTIIPLIFLVTPIIYSEELLKNYQLLYLLNPVYYVVDFPRDLLIDGKISVSLLIGNLVFIIFFLIIVLFMHKKLKDNFRSLL